MFGDINHSVSHKRLILHFAQKYIIHYNYNFLWKEAFEELDATLSAHYKRSHIKREPKSERTQYEPI